MHCKMESWIEDVIFQLMYGSGDSWTTTEFDPNGAQPREENPMGNPEFPYVLHSGMFSMMWNMANEAQL